MDAMATSIMSSVGCLVVMPWSQMPGGTVPRTSAVVAVPRPEPQQLVGDRGDDRDEQDPADDDDQRASAPDQRAEHEDGQR